MNRTIMLGIDNGNKATKSSSGYICESGFIKSYDEPIVKKRLLRFQEGYYSLGNHIGVKWDKSETEDTFILSLPAIAERIDEE